MPSDEIVTGRAKLCEIKGFQEYKWYPVYTRICHEKAVAMALKAIDIEVFLPTMKKLVRWSDRNKWIEKPLFPSYLFVNVRYFDFQRVLSTSSVVGFIVFNGKAVSVSNDQIHLIKKVLEHELAFEITPQTFELRQKVEIMHGCLKGHRGVITDFNRRKRLLVELDGLDYSLLVEISGTDLKKIN